MTGIPRDVLMESPHLRYLSLVPTETDPETRSQVQVAYLRGAGNTGMRWLGDTGKGRKPVKCVLSNQLLWWELELNGPSKHQEMAQNTQFRIILPRR